MPRHVKATSQGGVRSLTVVPSRRTRPLSKPVQRGGARFLTVVRCLPVQVSDQVPFPASSNPTGDSQNQHHCASFTHQSQLHLLARLRCRSIQLKGLRPRLPTPIHQPRFFPIPEVPRRAPHRGKFPMPSQALGTPTPRPPRCNRHCCNTCHLSPPSLYNIHRPLRPIGPHWSRL